MVADLFAGLGVLCLVTSVAVIALGWWECHCEIRQERRAAALAAKWQAGLPDER